jgi:hypothetical protein
MYDFSSTNILPIAIAGSWGGWYLYKAIKIKKGKKVE